MMRKQILALLVIFSLVLVLGGCNSPLGGGDKIGSQEEADAAVEDVSADIDEVTEDIEGINSELG